MQPLSDYQQSAYSGTVRVFIVVLVVLVALEGSAWRSSGIISSVLSSTSRESGILSSPGATIVKQTWSNETPVIEESSRASVQPVDSRPRNVKLVFIGDSLLRYQYLSLVFYLRWGRWFDPTIRVNNLVNEISFVSPFHNGHWNEFFMQTNRMLAPYEQCDCFRKGANVRIKYAEKVVENHYYFDPELNNSVTYFVAVGNFSTPQGRLSVDDIVSRRNSLTSTRDQDAAEKEGRAQADALFTGFKRATDIQWSCSTWGDLVRNVVARIAPSRPTSTKLHLIMNAGKWANSFDQADTRMELVHALNDTGLLKSAYWQTTPYGVGGVSSDLIEQTDADMCLALNKNCLNVSWTAHASTDSYWDGIHFYEPAYRIMNEELLDRLGYLPPNHVRQPSVL